MATYTPNYNLKKPDQTDFYDVDDFNGNADIIDAALDDKANKIVHYTPIPTPYNIASGTVLHYNTSHTPIVMADYYPAGQFLLLDNEFDMFGAFSDDGDRHVLGYAKIDSTGNAFEFVEIIYDSANGGWIGVDSDGLRKVSARISDIETGTWEYVGEDVSTDGWDWTTDWQEVNFRDLKDVSNALTAEIGGERSDRIAADALKEDAANKVSVSSTATVTQYPNAKSVYDYVQDVIALIPAGGLKVPVSLDKESDLPTTGQSDGDYYYVQDMDITAPGHTGRAWWNSAESTDWLKVTDQYGSMDGVSIVETGGGEWEVSTEWLDGVIAAAISAAPPSGLLIKEAAWNSVPRTLTIIDTSGIPNPIPAGYMMMITHPATMSGAGASLVIPGISSGGSLYFADQVEYMNESTAPARALSSPILVRYRNTSGSSVNWTIMNRRFMQLDGQVGIVGVLPMHHGGTGTQSFAADKILQGNGYSDIKTTLGVATDVDTETATDLPTAGAVKAYVDAQLDAAVKYQPAITLTNPTQADINKLGKYLTGVVEIIINDKLTEGLTIQGFVQENKTGNPNSPGRLVIRYRSGAAKNNAWMYIQNCSQVSIYNEITTGDTAEVDGLQISNCGYCGVLNSSAYNGTLKFTGNTSISALSVSMSLERNTEFERISFGQGGIVNISGYADNTVKYGTYTGSQYDWAIRLYTIMSIALECGAYFGKIEAPNKTNSNRMIIDERPGRPLETYMRKTSDTYVKHQPAISLTDPTQAQLNALGKYLDGPVEIIITKDAATELAYYGSINNCTSNNTSQAGRITLRIRGSNSKHMYFYGLSSLTVYIEVPTGETATISGLNTTIFSSFSIYRSSGKDGQLNIENNFNISSMSCYIDAVRNFTVKRFTCSGGICNISGNSEDTVILGTYTSPTPSQDWGIRNYSIMSIADDCKAVFGKFEPNNATNSTRMIIDNRPGRPLETYARKAEIPATDGGLIKTCTYTGTSSTPNYTLAVDDVTGIPNPIPKGYKLTLICSTALTRRTNYLSIPGILEGVTLAVKTNFLPGATSTTGIAVPVNTPFNVQLVNSGSTNYWIYQDLPIISLGSAGAVNGTLPVGYGGTGRTSYTANQLVRAGTSGTAALVNDIALSTTMPDAPTDLMVPSTKLLKTAVDGVGTDLHTNYRTTSDTDTYVNQQIADASLNTFKREYDGEVGIGVDVIPSGDAPSVTASNGDRYFTLAYNNDPDGLPIGWIIICWEYENGSWGFSSTLLPIAATDLHWVAVEKDSDIEGYYVIKTGEDEDSLPKWELLGSGAALVGDNDTIEITGDVISVKTGGIMADQIAEFSVGTSKLAMESITEDRLDPDLADKVNSNGMLMKIATGTIDDMVIDADGFPDPIPYGYRFLLKLPTFTVETSPYLTVTGLIPKTRVGNVYLNNPNTYTNNYASPKLSNIYVLVNYTRIINNNVFTILEDSYINVQAGVGKVTGILDKYNGGIGIALNPGSPGLLTNVDNFTEKMKITPLVTEVSDTSTDSEVPTAKAVQTAIDAIPTPSGGGLLIKEGTVVQSQNPPKWTITISDTSGFPNPIPNGYEFILICDYTFAGFRYNKYHFITIPSIAEDIPTMITPVDGNSGYYGFMGANPNVPIHLRYRNTGTTTAWQFVDEHYINLSYSNPQIKFEGYLPLPWGGTGLNAVPTTPSVVMSDSTVSTTAMQYRALLDGDIADNPESDAIPNVRQVAEYVQQLLNN